MKYTPNSIHSERKCSTIAYVICDHLKIIKVSQNYYITLKNHTLFGQNTNNINSSLSWLTQMMQHSEMDSNTVNTDQWRDNVEWNGSDDTTYTGMDQIRSQYDSKCYQLLEYWLYSLFLFCWMNKHIPIYKH